MTKEKFVQGFVLTFIINIVISYLYVKRNMDFSEPNGDIGFVLVSIPVVIFSLVAGLLVGWLYSKSK